MTRVLGLDVNPGTSHFNVTTMESVSVTHWQLYPQYVAEPDERVRTHREWLFEFLKRANINSVGDLVAKTEDEMMKVRNLGKKSLEEVVGKLNDINLTLATPEEEA